MLYGQSLFSYVFCAAFLKAAFSFYNTIYDNPTVGSFKFCVIYKSVPGKSGLSVLDKFILNTKFCIRKLAGSKVKWSGLDNSTIIYEKVPVVIASGKNGIRIQRAK